MRFNLTNISPYNFYEVGVVVVLVAGDSIQAVGKQVITNLNSQEPRILEFMWPGQVPTVDRMIVKPEVNVFDSAVFKKL